MSNFFLHNDAINVKTYGDFRQGMLELIAIRRLPDHIFWKNDLLYSLPILINGLYVQKHGVDEQEIYRFLEQMNPSDQIIDTEPIADAHCQTNVNGFLGIDFSQTAIASIIKKITNRDKYKDWCFHFLANLENILVKTTIEPSKKKVHLSDHHGKKELKELCDRLKNSPYVEEMRSTNWGGKDFIRSYSADGMIDIVLHKTDRQYALNIKTTGTDILETEAIAKILQEKYDQ